MSAVQPHKRDFFLFEWRVPFEHSSDVARALHT